MNCSGCNCNKIARPVCSLANSALAILLSAASSLFASDIRITTWNLNWFPNGAPKEAPITEQERRVHAAADVLRALNPDIILLQEIRDYEAVEKLANTVKPGAYQIAICSAFKERGQTGRQQVVILAKEAAQAAWAEPWKSMQGVDPPRGFAFAWFKVKGADLGVYCVHLKSNLILRGDKASETLKNARKREVAAEQVLDHIKSVVAQKMPAVQSFVIGGDFNTNKDEFATETTLTNLEQNGFRDCMAGLSASMRVTHPGGHGYPDTTFDYFFAKGATLNKPLITRSQASDHLPVTCTVSLSSESSAKPISETSTTATPFLQPTTPPQEFVRITLPVTIKIRYGTTILQRGMKLPVVSRDARAVRIRYMNEIYVIPVSSTDLK